MSKRGLANRTFLFSLLAILLFASIFAVSSASAATLGQSCTQNSDCEGVSLTCTNGVCTQVQLGKSSLLVSEGCDKATGIFSKAYCVWFGGFSSNFDLSGEVIKWLFLFLIIILIYSALSQVKFPEGAGSRFLISVIVGVLATFLITTQELLSILQSYSALGVTLTVFFPIAVLLFFTILVATKASPLGIFVQKIMWIIYSVYLFFKTWMLYIISNTACTISTGTTEAFKSSIAACHGELGVKVVGWLSNNQTVSSLVAVKGKFDTPMLVILLVVAIAVFIVMVISNQPIRIWIAKERYEADIEVQKENINRQQALRKAESGATRGEAV